MVIKSANKIRVFGEKDTKNHGVYETAEEVSTFGRGFCLFGMKAAGSEHGGGPCCQMPRNMWNRMKWICWFSRPSSPRITTCVRSCRPLTLRGAVNSWSAVTAKTWGDGLSNQSCF